MEKTKTISESTLVPISMLITLLLFSAWLTNVWADGQANKFNIQELKNQQKDDVQYFRDQVEKMNEKLDRILSKQK